MTSTPSNSTGSSCRRAVLLLSGGLDSYTVGGIVRSQGFITHALTVNYGQRHQRELQCARAVAQHLAVADHKVINLDLRLFGGSALTAALDVPKDNVTTTTAESNNEAPTNNIPITYVPARNTVLLSLALAWAEVIGAFDIFIGANAVDYSGYPDCRAEFIDAFAKLANLATRAAVQGEGRFVIHAPLLDMSKGHIIRKGKELGLDYALTHSCYDPDEQGRACGRCDSCRLRLKGFAEAQMVDPVEYQTR